MHILTGMIIAALLRRRDKSQTQAMGSPAVSAGPPFRSGPLRIEHTLAGRTRLRAPSLVGDEVGRERLESKLGGVEGIHRLEINSITGSVLVHHDAHGIRADLIFAAIARVLGLEDELENVPTPVVARELRDFAQSVNRAVYEKTGGLLDLWTLSALALAGVGIRKVLAEGRLSLPTGFTLVWWATHMLRGGGVGEHA
jgi:hypothetical protein